MKKKIIGAAFLLLFAMGANAQNARETSVSIDKNTQSAFVADYTFNQELLEKTLEDKLSKAGLSKSKKYKGGFKKYEGVMFSALSPNKIDFYTKVEGKKNNSTLVVLVSTGYDNFVSRSTDPATAQNVMDFLNNMNNDASVMKAMEDLAAQERKVKEAEATLNDVKGNKEKLERKKAELEKDIAKVQSEQEAKMQELEKEKARLEQMKMNGEGQ